jgi:hypothetical protein
MQQLCCFAGHLVTSWAEVASLSTKDGLTANVARQRGQHPTLCGMFTLCNGVLAMHSVNNLGTARGPRRRVLASDHIRQSPLTRPVRAHTLVGHGKEVVQRMNDSWTCEVTAS